MCDLGALDAWRRGCGCAKPGPGDLIIQTSSATETCFSDIGWGAPDFRSSVSSLTIDLSPVRGFVSLRFNPHGATNDCGLLSPLALLLWGVASNQRAAMHHALSGGVFAPLSACLHQLAIAGPKPLACLLNPGTAELLARELRGLLRDVCQADDSPVDDVMHVPSDDVRRLTEPGVKVPVAAIAILFRAMRLRVNIDFACRGTVTRHEVGASGPHLGTLEVRDGHMCAVRCCGEGGAPEPPYSTVPPRAPPASPLALGVSFDAHGIAAAVDMPDGSTRSLADAPLTLDAPLGTIGERVAEATGLPAHEQRLVLDGRAVDATEHQATLRSLGASAHSRLLVVPYPRVGGDATPSVPGAPASLPPAGAPPLPSAQTAIASSAHTAEDRTTRIMRKRGYLKKQPVQCHLFSSARRRFFVLDDSILSWYESEESMARSAPPKGRMQIVGAHVTRQGAKLVVSAGGEHLVLCGDDLDEWERCCRSAAAPAGGGPASGPVLAPAPMPMPATELAAIALEDGEGRAESHSEEAVVDAGADAIVRVESAPAATLSAAATPSVPGAPASLPPAGAPPLPSAPTAIASSAHVPSAALAALAALDDGLVETFEKGHIRLVRTAWLLAQPATYRLERRQGLEERERQGEAPFLSSDRAVALVRHAVVSLTQKSRRPTRRIGVVSHGWLSPGDVRNRSSNRHAVPARLPSSDDLRRAMRSPTLPAHASPCCAPRSASSRTSRASSSTFAPSSSRRARRFRTSSSYALASSPPTAHRPSARTA